MGLTTYTALSAKNQFGQLLDDAQIAPVEITKHNRPVGALLSMQKLREIAEHLLSEPLKKAVDADELSVTEAINEQLKMDAHISEVLTEVASGKVSEPDNDFWQRIRDKAGHLNAS